ncbi:MULTISPECIES: fimbria/pilus outer membrane usher protein [Burkholderia]|uniref:fimbria/pilus outer membrane usher protein n=1 Tax=Burkholderia TaxID=32008 RepID=UPI000A983ED1|nr:MULTISPECIES: fimbria/pilus outer membrane usher protein [Burkholderia]MCA8106504.1 fimbria/pilus outer membrane usher protein [Burkholderia sp. AU36459]WJN76291.1 Sigma-fimbriae usher protein [Burkholderia anthina]
MSAQTPHAQERLVAAPAAAAAQASHGAAGGPAELLYQVDINRQGLDETALLIKAADGAFYVSADDLKRWRLRRPDVAPLAGNDTPYYPLNAIAGLTYTVDEQNLTMAISAPAQAFVGATFDETERHRASAVEPGIGGFFNYDLLAEQAAGQTHGSGLFELGFFNRFGVGVGTFLADEAGPTRRLTRLETTWTTDRPGHLASLRIGDAISRAGMWGRAVRFGGIQYATNFATQPGLVTIPLQGVSGQAVLPSTVDVYVNNALTSTREVAPGPFAINNVPVVTGQGDVRVVVRDVMGREQVITQSFYASANLLKRGMQDFSYEIGKERRDFGLASNDYGRWFASATHRIGMTDRFTGEIHAEAEASRQNVGVGGVVLAGPLGVLNAAAAASRSAGGAGALATIGAESQAGLVEIGAHAQWATPHFAQIGLEPGRLAPKLLTSVNVGLGMGRFGSLGLAHVFLDDRDGYKTQLLSLSYSAQLGRFGFANVSVSKPLSGAGATIVGVAWTIPVDNRTSASVTMMHQQGRTEMLAQLQRSLPVGEGFGYALQAGNDTQDASATLQTRTGTYSVEAAAYRGRAGVRANVAGGVAFVDGTARLSRQITDSFALVKVPGFANVGILADNQLVAHTDASGVALLPRLRAYENNPISIEQADLPFDATIGTLKLDAVPYFRSGMALVFPITRSRGAMLTLDLADGAHLPAGAIVTIDGRKDAFPVGRDGVVYVTGLSEQNRLHAAWRDRQCDVTVRFPAGDDPLPDLGTHLCKGVTP